MAQRFVEAARVRRVEGTGEWAVLIDRTVLESLTKTDITGVVKTTAPDKIEISISLNPARILPKDAENT